MIPGIIDRKVSFKTVEDIANCAEYQPMFEIIYKIKDVELYRDNIEKFFGMKSKNMKGSLRNLLIWNR